MVAGGVFRVGIGMLSPYLPCRIAAFKMLGLHRVLKTSNSLHMDCVAGNRYPVAEFHP